MSGLQGVIKSYKQPALSRSKLPPPRLEWKAGNSMSAHEAEGRTTEMMTPKTQDFMRDVMMSQPVMARTAESMMTLAPMLYTVSASRALAAMPACTPDA